jgi:hypothetical protein
MPPDTPNGKLRATEYPTIRNRILASLRKLGET